MLRYGFLPILIGLAACAAGEARGPLAHEWTAAVDTVGDTVVVRTLEGSVWGDTARLEVEVSIGVLEGDDEYILGEVEAIAVSQTGEIWVLDLQVPAVRRYARDGTHLGDIGRRGGGPGEFERPEAMARLPDGRLLVRDPGNARISVHGPDGAYLSSWRLPGGGTFSTSRPVAVDTAGNSYTMILMRSGVAVTEWTYGMAKFDPNGVHTDTLLAPTWDYERAVVTASREGSSSSSSVPFTPNVEWTFSPLGYFVGGISTDYRVDLLRSGAPTLRIEREWTPVPVLPAEKAERERSIASDFQRSYGSWRWNGPAIPDTKPPFEDVMADDDGRIWVMVAQPSHEWRSAADAEAEEERTGRPALRFRSRTVFDVYEPGGRFLGPVVVPEGFTMFPQPVIRGSSIWAVTRDDLDVARVVRYRLTVPAVGR